MGKMSDSAPSRHNNSVKTEGVRGEIETLHCNDLPKVTAWVSLPPSPELLLPGLPTPLSPHISDSRSATWVQTPPSKQIFQTVGGSS